MGYGRWYSSRVANWSGLLTLQQVDGGNEVEIGYHVRRDLWGQGLATEAARACRDFGFARLPVERMISLILRCPGHREQQAAQRLRQNFHLDRPPGLLSDGPLKPETAGKAPLASGSKPMPN